MPNTFSPLIVPATMAQEGLVRQLLLYFETVFLYTPVERSHSGLPPEFSPLCQPYAPVPFGTSLANFEQLIRDMTSHRAEYYGGGLSSLSARANSIDEESVWRLIGQLAPGASDPARQDPLLQSRLLLRLAEIRDQEELEIARTLAAVDCQGMALLHGLTAGDDDDEAGIGGLISHPAQQSGDTLDQRLQAWAQLFLADPRMNEHWLLAATPETLAVLADHATTSITEAPTLAISLPLPGKSVYDSSPTQYLAQRQGWRTAAADCLTTLRETLLVAAASALPAQGSGLTQELEARLAGFHQWGAGGHDTLDLWLLPRSLPQVFARIAKRPPPAPGPLHHAYGVVAVPRMDSANGRG